MENLNINEKWQDNVLPTLSRRELYDFEVIELSMMILSLEKAIENVEGHRFLFLCFGSEGSADKTKSVKQFLEDYLQTVKAVYSFKITEQKKRKAFLEDNKN